MESHVTHLSPNFYSGRKRPLRLIVWHSTESDEKTGGAWAVGVNWFGDKKSKVSCHVTVDDGHDARYRSGVVQSVLPQNTAWHCGNANADGYGIEVVGRAGQSGAQWRDAYSLSAIANACRWIKGNPHLVKTGIPHRWLSDSQLKGGAAGHVTHEQVARVLGGSNHTDPGASFPKDYVMGCLGVAPAAPLPDISGVDVPLEYGMKNSDAVRKFQEFMRRVFSTYAGDLSVTGNYLDNTLGVVKEFQNRANVRNADGSAPDGKRVGPMTYAALRRYGWK